jgi:hypothetical protein
MTWTYLSKNGTDEYVNMFAHGSGAQPTTLETWDYAQDSNPLVIRGIMKHKLIKQCWADSRPFRYMDSGYFGNKPSATNPNGWKHWHRIVDNDLQHGAVVPRPGDRWERFGIPISKRRHGNAIIVAAPDAKPCVFYGVDLQTWIAETVATIKQHTDRPVYVRDRNPDPRFRAHNTFADRLKDDVHAVVTFNSVAATESVLTGVPTFVLAPCNAASPVGNTDLSQIDSPWFPDQDQIYAWASHLAYGQFHIDELASGTAARILQETKEITNA